MNNFFRKIREMNYNMHPAAKFVYGGLALLAGVYVLVQIAAKPWIILMILALYTGIVFHEVAHGYTAYKMGDPTAKIWRRLTLNPINHIDPIGLIMPILMIIVGSPVVLGWAKPVPVNYNMLRRKRAGLFLVAVAGITVNIINAVIAALLLKLLPKESIELAFSAVWGSVPLQYLLNPLNIAAILLAYIFIINIGLALFNLLPIPPLDGSKIIEAFGSYRVREVLESMEKYGFVIIIVLLYFNIPEKLIMPVFIFALRLLGMFLGVQIVS